VTVPSVSDLGVATVAAILILREVFAFLKKRNGGKNGSAGDKTVEFWQQQNSLAFQEALRFVVVPILSNQAEILKEIKSAAAMTAAAAAASQQRLTELVIGLAIKRGEN
jgi:hypothetical protein